MTTEAVPTYQLKIALRHTSPPVWRRVTLPADTSLGCLHDVIQTCFGWDDSHLHAFVELSSGQQFVDYDTLLDDGIDSEDDSDEESASVADLLPHEGRHLDYVYDFGDDWQHRITLEKIHPGSAGDRGVHCTGGRRAMPYAEDIGGVWGLQAVLDAVADRTAPAPEPWTDMIESLREEGFDPADFDRVALDQELSELDAEPPTVARPLSLTVRTTGSAAGSGPGGYLCSCGEIHDDDRDVDSVPVRPASLAPRADLATAARAVPLIDAALRLAHWCQGGRAVTSRDVLKPGLGRTAVQELQLWTQDHELNALPPSERDQRLSRARSSGDLTCLNVPWQLALRAGLVEIGSGKARPGTDLATASADEGVLTLWSDALGVELSELDHGETLGLPPVLLSAVGLGGEYGAGLAEVVLRALYDLADGQWLDTAPLVTVLSESLPPREARLIELLLLQILDHVAPVLAGFQAAEVETDSGPRRPRDLMLLDVLGIVGINETGDDTPEPGRRLRLTPLGRHGLREFLLAEGVPAPLIGELADADVPTLLDALLEYDQESAHEEITGWISHRGQGPAAVQLIDACGGLDADAAIRRLSAGAVLAQLDSPKALTVLRKAAASKVPGCAQTAALTLIGRGETPEGHGPELRLWGVIDYLWGPLGLADEALAEFLDQERDSVLPLLDESADELWRCDHPATGAVLEAAGRHLKTRDKALAKRLRKSATKVGSQRRG